jgi:SAM-dependent methyltransferase
MDLKATYENPRVHRGWESAYRGNPLLDRFNDRIMDRLLGLMAPPAGARLLDAGCGIGDHARRLARRGYHVTGVDISEHILATARRMAADERLSDRCGFVRDKLESLPFPDGTFDAIHCRGVLMHIPDWEQALGELCRVLRPGGPIAVVEGNHRAVEARLVGLLRKVRRSKSRIVHAPGGVESWAEVDGQPFVARQANIRCLMDWLRDRGFQDIRRGATEFLDVHRIPAGIVRDAVIRFNRAYFALGGPAGLSMGNAVVARKPSAP